MYFAYIVALPKVSVRLSDSQTFFDGQVRQDGARLLYDRRRHRQERRGPAEEHPQQHPHDYAGHLLESHHVPAIFSGLGDPDPNQYRSLCGKIQQQPSRLVGGDQRHHSVSIQPLRRSI